MLRKCTKKKKKRRFMPEPFNILKKTRGGFMSKYGKTNTVL